MKWSKGMIRWYREYRYKKAMLVKGASILDPRLKENIMLVVISFFLLLVGVLIWWKIV